MNLPCIYCVFIVYLLCIYCVFTVYLLCIYCVFTVYLLCMFKSLDRDLYEILLELCESQ